MQRVVLPLPLPLLLLSLPVFSFAQEGLFEPNQTRRTASVLEPGDYKGLFCNEDDWYVLEVPEGQRLEVSASFQHQDGDLELEVRNARGQLLGRSRSSNDEELLALHLDSTQQVFVHVHHASTHYDLHVGLQASSPQREALRDVNCWGSDWYPFELHAGEGLRATLAFEHDQGDLDLELLDEEGTQLATSSGKDDSETLRFDCKNNKRVLLHVYHVHRSRNVYSLSVDQGVEASGDLEKVFRQERGQGAGEDLLELRSGELLSGTVQNETLALASPYAELSWPTSRLAGLDFSEGGLCQVVTVDEDSFSGYLRTDEISFRLKAMNRTIKLRHERVGRLVFGRRGDERSSERPPHSFELSNGDRFRGRLLSEGQWSLDMEFADVPLDLTQVEVLLFDGEGTATLTQSDGTSLRGRLQVEALEVELEEVRFRVHPSRVELVQLKATTAPLGRLEGAQLRHLLLRLAPSAPRRLVRAICDGEDVLHRLQQLRPLVRADEHGSQELVRHIRAVEDPALGHAWFEILVRRDRDLRFLLAQFVGNTQEAAPARLAAAEILCRFAIEGGDFGPLESAKTSSNAAPLVMKAGLSLGNRGLQEWLMSNLRQHYRGGRGEHPTPQGRQQLGELLPRLLQR